MIAIAQYRCSYSATDSYASLQTVLRKYDGQELEQEGTEKVQGLVSRELKYICLSSGITHVQKNFKKRSACI